MESYLVSVRVIFNTLVFVYGFDSLISQVLAHSWEWIEWNGGNGLTSYSEEPLEAKQGVARNLRNHNIYHVIVPHSNFSY